MNQYQYQSDQGNVQATAREEVLSVGQWLLTTFVIVIPLIGLIMMFVWGFGAGNKSRANFCKAILLWYVIIIVASIMFGTLLLGALASLSGAF